MTAAQVVSQPPLNLELCQSMAMQVGLQLIHAFPFVSSCSTEYFVACFAFSASTTVSMSLIIWAQGCFLVGGGTSYCGLSKVSECFLQLLSVLPSDLLRGVEHHNIISRLFLYSPYMSSSSSSPVSGFSIPFSPCPGEM